VRIPLDYYRVLGVTIQATDEQLHQAYHDRGVQLPRREYSEEAIAARRDLIEEAYQVLSNKEKRERYNAQFLEKTYQVRGLTEKGQVQSQRGDRSELESIYDRTPWLDIAPDRFVGALLILQELGEYELVLRLGIPEINNDPDAIDPVDYATAPPSASEETKYDRRADIALTLALAYLELGREQWQQEEYQNAALSGQIGLDLLTEEGIFPSVRDEIRADLFKLRPYRILSLISQNREDRAHREEGIQLLQEMLQDRGGIDGKGDDGSGLDIDHFLRFLQQLRQQLTAIEQQQLFEAEAKRPSAVARYLAVYTLLARGFAERNPASIVRAKDMLAFLGKRQDVYLEKAVCALLLGQTEEASHALEKSQDKEPLEFIRENSQGAPDLLPGLCFYGEHWLKNEVLTQFRDLAERQDSLQDYFADRGVQAYLEQLSSQSKSEDRLSAVATAVRTGLQQHQQHAQGKSQSYNISGDSEANGDRHRVFKEQELGNPTNRTATVERPNLKVNNTPNLKIEPKTPQLFNYNSVVSETSDFRQVEPSRSPKRSSTMSIVSKIGKKAIQKLFTPSIVDDRNQHKKYWLIIAAAILGMGTLGFVSTQNLLKKQPTPQIEAEAEQLNIQLDKPQVNIPPVATKPIPPKSTFTQEDAKQIIQNWLEIKAQAFGSSHKVDRLNTILSPPLLSQWQKRAEAAKIAKAHMQYKHSIQVRSVKFNEQKPDSATIEAQIREVAQNYLAGKANKANSYNDTLTVRYELLKQSDRWLIKNLKVVK
jgi:curved DNA-binding protein CbpA